MSERTYKSLDFLSEASRLLTGTVGEARGKGGLRVEQRVDGKITLRVVFRGAVKLPKPKEMW